MSLASIRCWQSGRVDHLLSPVGAESITATKATEMDTNREIGNIVIESKLLLGVCFGKPFPQEIEQENLPNT